MMFKKLALTSIAAAMALTGLQATAATTANVAVSLNVTAGCLLYVGTPGEAEGTAELDLGALTTFGGGVVDRTVVDGATGEGNAGGANVIGVSCGNNGENALSPVLTVTGGTNDDDNARRLSNGADFIPYTLSSSASGDPQSVLQNGAAIALTGTADSVGGGTSAATLFARVTNPAAVTAAGSYSDNIILTLTF
jgi:spore coat protein U-like protein